MSRSCCRVFGEDHTGHAQAFVSRRGVSAPRGASSKGQKVDVLIEFRPVAQSEFRLEVAKMRVGGLRPRPIGCRVVDLEDDRLDIETETGAVDPVVKEVAEQMVVAIENAGEMTTNALRAAAPASRENQQEAIRLLETDPPRVKVTQGPRRTKIWVPVGPGMTARRRTATAPGAVTRTATTAPLRSLRGAPAQSGSVAGVLEEGHDCAGRTRPVIPRREKYPPRRGNRCAIAGRSGYVRPSM